jgi:chorismate mutase/prephenate dehydrogenase
LDALRHEIERVDQQIAVLLSKREEVAREIGLTKRKDGVKIRDPERERKVVAKMVSQANSLGADSRLAREVARLLIADAIRVQKEPGKDKLKGKNALVVGGSGKMGEWVCRFLSNRGACVKVWDPRGRISGYSNIRSLRPAIDSSDIIILASPLGVCHEELRQIMDAKPKGLILDICSVKSHIATTLRQGAANGLRIASVHPMFGPRAASPKGLNVIVCDCGNRMATKEARTLFKAAGANVAELYLEEHDKVMAFILGLPHIAALAFGNTIRASGRKASELGEVQGTSFSRLAELSAEVSGESRRVYHDIQALNPNTREMIEALETALDELKSASLKTEHEDFIRLMNSAKENLEK